MVKNLERIKANALACLLATLLLVSCDGDFLGFGLHKEELMVSPLATKLGFSKDRPLVMGMNTSYPPLQYVDNDGQPSGCDVEFTKILMRRLGIPFTFSPNHWDKMSPGIIGGKYDMGMLVYSSYRKDKTNYSNAVFRIYYQIVYRKKDYKEFDFRHLKGKRIAYMKSRPVGTMLKEAEADEHAITDLSEAISDLNNGKYDGVICYRFQAKYNIEQLGLSRELQADELSMEPREYCYASASKELIDAINVELERMEQQGIIDDVYGQDVVSTFGAIRIPNWVWGLLALLTFLFLVIFSVNRSRLSKRLKIAYDEMAKKNDALVVATAKAEESTRMKSEFIKQISHEIRTPLNILNGFSQVITSSGMKLSEEELHEASLQIQENTDRITGLVNKMLELSEVSSISVLERDDETTPENIARQAMIESGICDVPHLEFSLVKGDAADQILKTNCRSAVRILVLLLDNAAKFTHPAETYNWHPEAGQPKQHASLTLKDCDGMVQFIVEDTGKGVPAEEAEHIFDEFVQLDNYYDGTGIGLSVARSLARRLGGDIVLDTTYTDGARFVFSLPM